MMLTSIPLLINIGFANDIYYDYLDFEAWGDDCNNNLNLQQSPVDLAVILNEISSDPAIRVAKIEPISPWMFNLNSYIRVFAHVDQTTSVQSYTSLPTPYDNNGTGGTGGLYMASDSGEIKGTYAAWQVEWMFGQAEHFTGYPSDGSFIFSLRAVDNDELNNIDFEVPIKFTESGHITPLEAWTHCGLSEEDPVIDASHCGMNYTDLFSGPQRMASTFDHFLDAFLGEFPNFDDVIFYTGGGDRPPFCDDRTNWMVYAGEPFQLQEIPGWFDMAAVYPNSSGPVPGNYRELQPVLPTTEFRRMTQFTEDLHIRRHISDNINTDTVTTNVRARLDSNHPEPVDTLPDTIDETNIDETNIDETNIDETNIDETNIDAPDSPVGLEGEINSETNELSPDSKLPEVSEDDEAESESFSQEGETFSGDLKSLASYMLSVLIVAILI